MSLAHAFVVALALSLHPYAHAYFTSNHSRDLPAVRPLRVFGGPGEGEFASPAALAAALREQKKLNVALAAELQQARGHGAAAERRCLDILSQHHRAHAAERERVALRHAQSEARLRDTHAANMRSVGGASATEAADAASRAHLRAAMLSGDATIIM